MSRLSAAATVEVHFSWQEAPELRASGTVWSGAGTCTWIWDVHRGCDVLPSNDDRPLALVEGDLHDPAAGGVLASPVDVTPFLPASPCHVAASQFPVAATSS